MEASVVVFALGCAIVGGLYLWAFTQDGKKWLKNL